MEEHKYTDGKTEVRYLIGGQGQTLLFLHGVGVSTKSYEKAIELLSQKYKVIAPDLPGFGKSSIPNKIWDYNDYANFLNIFLGSLGEKDVTAVGHSFGGEIALRMGTQNPQIKKLVLIGATGKPVRKSILGLLKIMIITKPQTNLKIYHNPKQLIRTRIDFSTNILRKFFHLYRLARTILKSIYGKWEIPASITTETTILWAEHDEVVNWTDAQELSGHLPNGKIIKLNEYHDWLLFKPELLMEFLS
jgi:abhydrolase domain-containing protein 6